MVFSFTDSVFSWLVMRKHKVIRVFQIGYAALFLVFIAAIRSQFLQDQFFPFFYDIALWCGKISLLFFICALVPGITRRFGIKHKLVAILMIFRRHLGISMYLLAFFHASVVRLLPMVRALPRLLLPVSLFEWFGFTSLCILLLLFATSNDLSMKTLKLWWYTLHKLIYIVMWLLLLHVGLQRISVWSVLMGITVTIQTVSFLALYMRNRSASQLHV